ncbi:hypothetical protein [Micromonospora chokoriensis]|uniref:Uncharacterized protein n=1 Tax=Micromonospora chokoriensis TaxID=356851 RepID=A0A1C4WIC2_9ACTN|nr:hypothetical protein [Micromonospora chokoriensis]SCE95884.1 hypothetical protein GA0070612_2509 [Micromonospora chokoriensis]
MRRLLAVTVVATVLAGAVGCSDRSGTVGPDVTRVATQGPVSGPASSAAAGDAEQVCAAAQRASTTAVRTYVAELGRMVAAVGAGDGTAAEAARGRAEAALDGWRTELRAQSERATDPQLKTMLTDLGTEVAALRVDVESIDETELDRLQQRLDQLCAR